MRARIERWSMVSTLHWRWSGSRSVCVIGHGKGGFFTQEGYIEESPENVPGQAGVRGFGPREFDRIQRVVEEYSVVGVFVVDGIYQLPSPNGIVVTVRV